MKRIKEEFLSLENEFVSIVTSSNKTTESFINCFAALTNAYSTLISDNKNNKNIIKAKCVSSLTRIKRLLKSGHDCPSEALTLINIQIKEYREELVWDKCFSNLSAIKFCTYIGNLDRNDYAPCFVSNNRKSFLELDKTVDRYMLFCDSIDDSVIEMLDTLAYIYGEPNFIFTENNFLNDQLESLYRIFSITEMIRIRSSSYFTKNHISIGDLLYHKKMSFVGGSKILVFGKLGHPEMLNLYHSSLKQFEPLPRCVLLYRVIEYSFSIYKDVVRPAEFEPAPAIDYFWQESQNYSYCKFTYKKYCSGKTRHYDFVKKLRKEANLIINAWATNNYLKNKSVGEVVYLTGRIFSAHGGNMARNARYDYSKNYKHINDVNIVLELIARFLIEKYNPCIKDLFKEL